MELLDFLLTLKKAVEKNDVAKGCLLGSATTIGTGGLVYIAKKLLTGSKEKGKSVNLTVD